MHRSTIVLFILSVGTAALFSQAPLCPGCTRPTTEQPVVEPGSGPPTEFSEKCHWILERQTPVPVARPNQGTSTGVGGSNRYALCSVECSEGDLWVNGEAITPGGRVTSSEAGNGSGSYNFYDDNPLCTCNTIPRVRGSLQYRVRMSMTLDGDSSIPRCFSTLNANVQWSSVNSGLTLQSTTNLGQYAGIGAFGSVSGSFQIDNIGLGVGGGGGQFAMTPAPIDIYAQSLAVGAAPGAAVEYFDGLSSAAVANSLEKRFVGPHARSIKSDIDINEFFLHWDINWSCPACASSGSEGFDVGDL